MLFGTGLAFFFGKPFIQPVAPHLPAISLGWWSRIPQVRAALDVNVLFLVGIALAVVLCWAFANTRIGLIIRVVGDSSDAARAMGLNPNTGAPAGDRGRRRARRRSAAPTCRSTIRAAGTRASPPARA